MSPTLQALLDDGAGFAAEYQGGLSNHLPMALLALRRLGASDQRLSAFFAGYSPRLEAAPAPVAWPAGDPWRGRFGQVRAEPAYRHLFRLWFTHEEGRAVLAQALPPLMAGCGAAAFHGLIRTAYAVQSGHLAEIADALAYWACRHLPISLSPGAAAPGAEGSTDLPQTLAALPRVKSKATLIFERMAVVAGHKKFAPTAGRLTVDAQTLPALARHAAQAYAISGNFVALHLVTSAHALRVLLPFIDDASDDANVDAIVDANRAVRDYWCAYAAAYAAAFPATFTAGAVVSEVVSDAADEASSLLTWPTIIKRAIGDNDEHVIKLVDSCREEERAYGGSVWRRAASRAVLSTAAARAGQ